MTDLTDEYLCALQDALLSGEQADMDGCRVKVSRQACEEAAATITALRQREATAVAGAIEAAGDHLQRLADEVWPSGNRTELADSVRTLHTDATRAALDRAKAEGMRAAAGIAQDCDTLGESYQYHELTEAGRVARSKVNEIVGAIQRAAADKLEGGL